MNREGAIEQLKDICKRTVEIHGIHKYRGEYDKWDFYRTYEKLAYLNILRCLKYAKPIKQTRCLNVCDFKQVLLEFCNL